MSTYNTSPPDNTSGPSIRVEIYDQVYNIRTDGNADYIYELAAYVDRRMREISSGSLTVDSLKVAILAALHTADEFHRLKNLHEQTQEEISARSSECVTLLDKVLRTL